MRICSLFKIIVIYLLLRGFDLIGFNKDTLLMINSLVLGWLSTCIILFYIRDTRLMDIDKLEKVMLKTEKSPAYTAMYQYEPNIIITFNKTPGTRGWSRLHDRKLAVPKIRAKICFFS